MEYIEDVPTSGLAMRTSPGCLMQPTMLPVNKQLDFQLGRNLNTQATLRSRMNCFLIKRTTSEGWVLKNMACVDF
jgi:hypothetical protein